MYMDGTLNVENRYYDNEEIHGKIVSIFKNYYKDFSDEKIEEIVEKVAYVAGSDEALLSWFEDEYNGIPFATSDEMRNALQECGIDANEYTLMDIRCSIEK